ncbi:hypothetical protein THRCLA_21282 [Thraustotheca clavata]|uniref:Uncharacterized protein n=1 Tax=Thraustotheca clavata TaxID=74557 RepID=A0A1V9ZY47_9STRA|nr:hypothetical protein THRCLA_21282 [Thraustotheca clavata]
MSEAHQVDLEAYFHSIDISQALLDEHQKGSLELPTLIYHHHTQAIPFENLSLCGVYPPLPTHANVEVGEVVSLDIDKIFQKLVLDRRDGYCLE